jgi:hypothetical protein
MLPIHSRDEGSASGSAGFPILLDRRFRPWRYSVSHSELSLRSVDAGLNGEFIEVLFYSVLGMKLKTVYQPLVIALADNSEAGRILEFIEIKQEQAPKIQCISLDAGGSFVACMRFSIWSHPRDVEYDSSGLADGKSRLICRG